MSVNYIMKAYLDDFGLINVFVNSHFYNGYVEKFYLRNELGQFSDCIITNVEKSKDFNRYELLIHNDYNFDLSHQIIDNHGYQCDLEIRSIVNQSEFEKLYAYDGDDLGNFYYPDHTDFAVWAPTASKLLLCYCLHEKTHYVAMEKKAKGVFRCRINENLDGVLYNYLFSINGKYLKTSDPFACSGVDNDNFSAVLNPEKLYVNQPYQLPVLNSYNDAIIYELSVKDFTYDHNSNVKVKGKFLSFCEDNTSFKGYTTGLAYLKELGITHVQLMPVFNFATTDEARPDINYNWGYDPLNYGILEGSYASDYLNPYARVNEFKKMVNVFHQNGIRVNVDVVFNHHYDIERCNLERLVPHYSFRYTSDGFLSNGSFCGNDIESRNYMIRQYIIRICERFVTLYDVDGLRFDLMGILDITTINMIYARLRKLKKDIMIYGEGWNMPTAMDDDEKAMQYNANKMPKIAFFNDGFRDVMKGDSSSEKTYNKGYLTGKIDLIHFAKNVLMGDCVNSKYLSASQSINYVECHDNQTAWDKIAACCHEDSEEIRLQKHKLLLASVLLAQGVPFLHSGQEFCRSKNGAHNTYNASPEVNMIDWQRRIDYAKMVNFTKDLISFRKEHLQLHYSSATDISKHVSFEELNGALVYNVDDLKIYFNPTNNKQRQHLKVKYQLILSLKGYIKAKPCIDEIVIPPYTFVVLQKCK